MCSQYRGNSNEYTQHTIFHIQKKIALIIPNLQLLDISKALKNEFETAVVNAPSVFVPLKVYCICEYVEVGFQNIKFDEYIILA